MNYKKLSKCRTLLKRGISLYKKKGKTLSEGEREGFACRLEELEGSIRSEDKLRSTTQAEQLEIFLKTRFPQAFKVAQCREFVVALAVAIFLAFLIRSYWFELYEVPTGSMRPTVQEKDRLLVSKTTFGIPLCGDKPLFYTPEKLARGAIVVFTVAGMDVADSDMRYFYLFPGKKRYIKRCMGKGGDTLYFYGGKIYGINGQGEPILELADDEALKERGILGIDHIPFITFEGKTSLEREGQEATLVLRQMNIPLGKIDITSHRIEGYFKSGETWVKDNSALLKSPHATPVSYSDLWGIKNYAFARLLTGAQVKEFYGASERDAPLYLELHHTPTLSFVSPELSKGRPLLSSYTALMPLTQEQLGTLSQSLYTARFWVKNEHAYRYSEGRARPQPASYDPAFPGVPDGCYEFQKGVGYRVLWSGILSPLKADHPLYAQTSENIARLFNLGLSFNTLLEPKAAFQSFYPQRFAYYRDGALFVMGTKLFDKEDESLKSFISNELEKEKGSPYIAFIDHGPPLTAEGTIDKAFVETFGLTIPEGHLLTLGDNYAMSADSREFGFAPIGNLRGSPAFTFWPFSPRIGPLPQPKTPWITLPNIVIWSAAFLTALACFFYYRRRNKKSLFKR